MDAVSLRFSASMKEASVSKWLSTHCEVANHSEHFLCFASGGYKPNAATTVGEIGTNPGSSLIPTIRCGWHSATCKQAYLPLQAATRRAVGYVPLRR
jgi:hypothetical protein